MDTSDRISIRGITLATALVSLPLVRGVTLHEEPGVSFGVFRLTTLHYFDLFVVLAVAAALLEWRRLRIRRSSVTVFAVAIVAALVISLVFNPSPRGLSMVVRWLAGGVLFASIVSMERAEVRRYVALPMLATAAFQGALAWIQLVTDSDAGFGALGGAAPRVVGDVARTAGTFAVPYLLAAYALVALGVAVAVRPKRPSVIWLALTAFATVPVAITFSRAALVGLIAAGVVAVLAMRRDISWRPLVLAVVVGFAIPALANLGSWTERAADSADALSPDQNVRYELVEQAVTLAGDNWLTGVGAGRYSMALEDEFALDARTAHPVHFAPLLFVVEVGVVLGLGVVVLGGRALYDVMRHSPELRVLVLLPAGFVLFDHLNVTHPLGPVLTMVWLALAARGLDADAADRPVRSDAEPVTTPAADA